MGQKINVRVAEYVHSNFVLRYQENHHLYLYLLKILEPMDSLWDGFGPRLHLLPNLLPYSNRGVMITLWTIGYSTRCSLRPSIQRLSKTSVCSLSSVYNYLRKAFLEQDWGNHYDTLALVLQYPSSRGLASLLFDEFWVWKLPQVWKWGKVLYLSTGAADLNLHIYHRLIV